MTKIVNNAELSEKFSTNPKKQMPLGLKNQKSLKALMVENGHLLSKKVKIQPIPNEVGQKSLEIRYEKDF